MASPAAFGVAVCSGDGEVVNIYATEEEIRYITRAACGGNQRRWCLKHALHPSNINDFLHGRVRPSKRLLEVLGYRRVVLYEVDVPF